MPHPALLLEPVTPRQVSPADGVRVSSVMTANVLCVPEDLSLEALTALFLTHDISGAPVVDAGGFPLGIVSKTDLVRDAYLGGEGTMVGDIMTPLTFKLSEHAALSQAAALMAYEGVHRVPVVSDEGRVIGILSALDVMRWLALNDGYLVRDPRAVR